MTSVTTPKTLSLRYRPLEPADIDRILELEKLIFDDPWPRSMFEDCLELPESTVIVALQRSRIVGYAAVELGSDYGHLTNIAVHPDYRRKSVAQRLMNRIFQFVRSGNREVLVLEVRPSSKAALKLYERWGFREMYRKPNYYRRPVEEAIVMAANLDRATKRK